MTRFARAHGSKSSNERTPEAATPWSVMRRQLQQGQDEENNASDKAKFENMRKENYEKFLKEQSEAKIQKSWCSFDDEKKSGKPSKVDTNDNTGRVSKNKLKKLKKAVDTNGEGKQVPVKSKNTEDSFNVADNVDTADNVKVKRKKIKIVDETIDSTENENDEDISNWLDEYTDKETDDKFANITAQIESMLEKSKKSKNAKSEFNVSVEEPDKKKSQSKSTKSSSEFSVSENVQESDTMLEVEDASESNSKKKNKKRKLKEENGTENVEVIEYQNLNVTKSKKRKVSEPSHDDTFDGSMVETKSKKKKKSIENVSTEDTFDDTFNSEVSMETKSKKKNKKSIENALTEETINSEIFMETKSKKKNKKSPDVVEVASEVNTETDNSKKKKNKKEKQNSSEKALDTVVAKVDSNKNKKKKKKELNPSNLNKSNENTKPLTKNEKKAKNEDFKRRKANLETSILIINGEELQVSNYDGFPILSKDAERLQDLRKNLISKGIARSEVNRTMKLERRKAEKSLSRMKKKLCFHCRKGGHNLSECPELNKKSDDTGMPSSGICFKCGSTEHTHFACKVVRTLDYKFAQCFICKEQGHISRQCPDNPRGLYPKGGGCRECGDVTHLKKDCPKIVKEREDNSMKLELMDSGNVEDVDKKPTVVAKTTNIKHVKF